jgi:hypothetical protein
MSNSNIGSVEIDINKAEKKQITDSDIISMIEKHIISEYNRIEKFIIDKNNNLTKKKEENNDYIPLEKYSNTSINPFGSYNINILNDCIEVYVYILNTTYYCYFNFEDENLTEIGVLNNKIANLLLFDNLPDDIKIEKMRSKKLQNIL